MGFFYFDESIQQLAGFIVGAFVYSKADLNPPVFKAIAAVKLRPGVDEFKSSARMDTRPEYVNIRQVLRGLLQTLNIGIVVVPAIDRDKLGVHALTALEKIIRANRLTSSTHRFYFDEGITFELGIV